MSKVDGVIDTGANFIFGDKVNVLQLHLALGGKPLRTRPGYFSSECALR
jgi:hypothetical protein